MTTQKEEEAAMLADARKRDAAKSPPNGKSNSKGIIPMIITIEKTMADPPYWEIKFAGIDKTLRIDDPQDITKYSRLQTKCWAQLNHTFPYLSQPAWNEHLGEFDNLIVEKQPEEDTTRFDEFMELLETYLTNRQRGEKRDDLLSGRPWEDQDKERHYFVIASLMKFFSREKFSVSRDQVSTWVKRLDGTVGQVLTIKGKSIRIWSVPSSTVQAIPEISTPELKEKPF